MNNVTIQITVIKKNKWDKGINSITNKKWVILNFVSEAKKINENIDNLNLPICLFYRHISLSRKPFCLLVNCLSVYTGKLRSTKYNKLSILQLTPDSRNYV